VKPLKVTLRRYEPGLDMFRLYDDTGLALIEDNLLWIAEQADRWTIYELGDHVCLVKIDTALSDTGLYLVRGEPNEVAGLLKARYGGATD
jgi:hypothetical protein